MKTLNGIDRLDMLDRLLSRRNVALVSGGSAINRALAPAVDVLCERYHVVKLFNLIYGIRGEFIYGERTSRYTDRRTGLPVESLFSRTCIAPTQAMLEGVDVLVFDIAEAGVRYYEYLACAGQLLSACSARRVPLVVLDRAAPIDGVTVEGTVCPPQMHTMVGDFELASRTALTLGEFCRYVNGEYHLGCDLTVVPVLGWKRNMYHDETALPWTLPSPSLPHVTANLLYAGMCIFEGVRTVSEGRGTAKPFELIGAPWIDAYELALRMNRLGLSGVQFGPVFFRPAASKHAGEVCGGVQVYVRERRTFESFRTALCLLEEIRALYPERIEWCDCSAGHDVKQLPSSPDFERYTDKLLATDAFTTGRQTAAQLIDAYAPARAQYVERKSRYHLYE